MLRLRDAEHCTASSEHALHALGTAVILLDGQGRVAFMNHAAERLIGRGLGIGLVRGRIQLADAMAQRDWQQALRASLAPQSQTRVAHFAEAVTWADPGVASTCTLQLSRLPVTSQFGLPAGAARVIAFITDGAERLQLDPALLTRTWGLSRAEARTALAMGSGGRLHDAATRLGLSANTLKSQLKQVYQKTGCSSRAELSRLMHSLNVA